MGGITTSTENNILYGTHAYMTVNNIDIGATTGDFGIEWEQTQYYPDFTQALGRVKGTGKVTAGQFRLTTTMTEWNYDVLKVIMASYGYSDSGDSERIGAGTQGTVTELPNVILTGFSRNDGKAVRVTIPYATVTIGNPTLNKTGHAEFQVTFDGLYTAAAPDDLPGKIEFEK